MSKLLKLANQLENISDTMSRKKIVTGFDGFIDQIVKIVDERKNHSVYIPVMTMPQFGSMITSASNRSSLREIVIESVDIGGCSVNLGDAIITLGCSLDFYGSMGKQMNPAFKDFAESCNHFTPLSCDPGLTMAMEFDDGKYMLSSISQLAEFTPEMLSKDFESDSYLRSCKEADLIAFTNWTLYPHMTDCWAYIQNEILNKLNHRPYIFIDLVDPTSRSVEDIKEMISVLSDFEKYGNTILGGNLNEGNILAGILGIDPVEEEGEQVAELADKLQKTLGISIVSLHCIGGSAYSDGLNSTWSEGPYCANPKKSTGAGDRYNAGFCLGTVLGLEGEDRLNLASSVSGYFVRNGGSGNLNQIIGLLRDWECGNLDK